MEIRPSPNQEALIRQAVEAGRFEHPEDAVKEALALWEERERARAEFRETLDDAEASLARGEGTEITRESMRELTDGIMERTTGRPCSPARSSKKHAQAGHRPP
jgi:Arc/MetJ-type ribon-helix-helix transcriptional regulator